MKENKAPEKLYLGRNIYSTYLYQVPDPDDDTAVEYSRTDAFIEKACGWLKNHYRDYMHNPTGKRLEAFFGGDMCNDFEDYMKVE
jgi:hypothetical protein